MTAPHGALMTHLDFPRSLTSLGQGPPSPATRWTIGYSGAFPGHGRQPQARTAAASGRARVHQPRACLRKRPDTVG